MFFAINFTIFQVMSYQSETNMIFLDFPPHGFPRTERLNNNVWMQSESQETQNNTHTSPARPTRSHIAVVQLVDRRYPLQ